MKLADSGREYAKWDTSALAEVELSVSFDGGATWYPMERPAGNEAQILVAGPNATDNPPGTPVLGMGHNAAAIRLTDNPEIVVREAGTIYVYAI